MQKLKVSFKAVFSGDGTNLQFAEVFTTILIGVLIIGGFFIGFTP